MTKCWLRCMPFKEAMDLRSVVQDIAASQVEAVRSVQNDLAYGVHEADPPAAGDLPTLLLWQQQGGTAC